MADYGSIEMFRRRWKKRGRSMQMSVCCVNCQATQNTCGECVAARSAWYNLLGELRGYPVNPKPFSKVEVAAKAARR